ncbi:MAG: HAD family hydrolase [Ruminococcaceae bacterium]|nr:HAD family hydrolase [Oscillospiraceae bacterium]
MTKIKAVLFDLDGTLLPMDQEPFANAYLGGLVSVAARAGYDTGKMADAVLRGTAAMVKNTGECSNEAAFWQVLVKAFGQRIVDDYHMFDDFYKTDFQKIKGICGYEPLAAEVIRTVKARGFRVALATNPLFPTVATESRIRWAGLSPDDFELFTTYENSHYCKPNPDYYKEVLSRLGLCAEECIMVGNDVSEDMIAEVLGMKVFLLTDCLINRKDADISVYPHGGFSELIEYLGSVE